MHFPSDFMLARMGLAEAGVWAVSVNDDSKIVFVAKLTTDTIKWISRGVPVNLLIAHVPVRQSIVRILALEIFDCAKPLVVNLPQTEDWEVATLDSLLSQPRFIIHFHNEVPFVSTLDAEAEFTSPSTILEYLQSRQTVQFLTAPVLIPEFFEAQDIFTASVDGKDTAVTIWRLPLSIRNPLWNATAVPNLNTFNPDQPDEGKGHEDLILQVLAPNFTGRVLPAPQILDGAKQRELCDVIAVGQAVLLFEAKAFSVFEKTLNQSAEGKAANVMKQFEKAMGQLKGAVKRIQNGIDVQLSNEVLHLDRASFTTVHGIVLVSNTSFALPWREIGGQLADAQVPGEIYYHLLPLTELQRIVAFSKGIPKQIEAILIRRGEIIYRSRDANIETDYKPEVTSVLRFPAASGGTLGLRFVVVDENIGNWLPHFFPCLYEHLFSVKFSGRLDIYHKLGHVEGTPALGIGMGAVSGTGLLGDDWWRALENGLSAGLKLQGQQTVRAGSSAIEDLDRIIHRFPERLLSVEFDKGYVVAKNAEQLQ